MVNINYTKSEDNTMATSKIIPENIWDYAIEYIGVKMVWAVHMSLGDYNIYREWTIPTNEDPDTEGYMVKYPDGYISWCPKAQFEEANRQTSGMTFGIAIESMKKGLKVARAGWNGKGMFLFLVPGSSFLVNRAPLLGIYNEGTDVNYQSHIDMKTADDTIVPWLASQSDMLADDWLIV